MPTDRWVLLEERCAHSCSLRATSETPWSPEKCFCLGRSLQYCQSPHLVYLPLALTQAPRIGLENHGVFCLVCDLDILKMKRKNKSGCSCEYESLIFKDLKPHKSDWEGRPREKILLLLVPSYSQQRKTMMRERVV